MPADGLSSTLKQLDLSDRFAFWLPSARWSNLPMKSLFSSLAPCTAPDVNEKFG
jgi:hypothetical protein